MQLSTIRFGQPAAQPLVVPQSAPQASSISQAPATEVFTASAQPAFNTANSGPVLFSGLLRKSRGDDDDDFGGSSSGGGGIGQRLMDIVRNKITVGVLAALALAEGAGMGYQYFFKTDLPYVPFGAGASVIGPETETLPFDVRGTRTEDFGTIPSDAPLNDANQVEFQVLTTPGGGRYTQFATVKGGKIGAGAFITGSSKVKDSYIPTESLVKTDPETKEPIGEPLLVDGTVKLDNVNATKSVFLAPAVTDVQTFTNSNFEQSVVIGACNGNRVTLNSVVIICNDGDVRELPAGWSFSEVPNVAPNGVATTKLEIKNEVGNLVPEEQAYAELLNRGISVYKLSDAKKLFDSLEALGL
jgi:hypothetical protein